MPDPARPLDLPRIAALVLRAFQVLSLACLAGCLVGLGLSLRRNGPLWVAPLRAEGTVVAVAPVAWQTLTDGTFHTTTAHLPVVVFRDAVQGPVRFTDPTDHGTAVGQRVPVLYARSDPSRARIDRGLLTWLDTGLWLFGVLAGGLGAVRLTGRKIDRMVAQVRTLSPASSPR